MATRNPHGYEIDFVKGQQVMCGIAGWYRRDRVDVPDYAIKAQCNAIRHRGPDDSGFLTDGNFGFGMRRLSILDVAGGHQPMCTPDGRFSIVFNGEIYNHLELRRDLDDAGYAFASHSDTETILAGYACWGDEVWPRLEGMFAVAIWDRVERRLVLARDPLGIKPLYITEQNGGLAFASELKALRVLPEHRFDICDRAVHDYFSFGHVRRPRSIFRQVRTLDPGHFMIVPHKGETVTKAFWTPEARVAPTLSVAEWTEQMRAVLLTTVGRHMQSDVPVGAFLSGGIDSSAVLAAMARNSQSRLKAFTVGYPGASIDETDAAREIARHLNCDHIVLPLELQATIDVLPDVQRCYDEPFADMAAVPTWYASKMAAEHVKVVLCGEGGDELFAGYKRHRNAQNIEHHRNKINVIKPVLSLIDRLPAGTSTRLNYLRQHAQRFGEFIRLPDGYQQFFAATQISRRSVRKAIYSKDFWNKYEGEDSYARLEAEYFPQSSTGSSALERFLLADLTVNMPSAMLTRLDRASMANSVEARVPFLSHRLVDWALTVPSGLKLRGNVGKFLLREAIAPWLPPSILKRPKQGFQMPLAKWFRGDFGDFARMAWNDSGASRAGYLDRRAVETLFQEHKLGTADHSKMLYAISVFCLWWQDQGFDSAQKRLNAA
jgi:asparagine synthase (glutamine-hydrolysing)